MRYVPFTPPVGDAAWDEWARKADVATSAMLAAYRRGDAVRPDDDTLWGELKTWLAEHAFARKCAYCEANISANAPQHAEHWRPKNGVQSVEDDGELSVVRRNGHRHPGYWWLAYDWRNVVPACAFCNHAGAKGTKFPIEGSYAFTPEEAGDIAELNRRERPLLLHPYGPLRPEAHIGFSADGTAYARNGSKYGEATIRVIDLNRELLVSARHERQEEALDALGLAVIDAIRSGSSVGERMERYDGDRARYSAAVRDRLDGPAAHLLSDSYWKHGSDVDRAQI